MCNKKGAIISKIGEIWILKNENIIMIQRRKEMHLKRDITIKKNQ